MASSLPRQPDNLLVDLDGTLTDPREGIVRSIRHALMRLDVEAPPEESLLKHIGPPLQQAFGEILGTGDRRRIDDAVDKYREYYADTGIYECSLYPGIADAIANMPTRGARLLLATSKPRVFAARIIEHFGLADHFDDVFGSELDGALADKQELIAHIMKRTGLTAAGTAMVGDRKHDAIGARANGVAAIGVLWGYGSRRELTDAGCVVLLDRPEDLSGLYGP